MTLQNRSTEWENLTRTRDTHDPGLSMFEIPPPETQNLKTEESIQDPVALSAQRKPFGKYRLSMQNSTTVSCNPRPMTLVQVI